MRSSALLLAHFVIAAYLGVAIEDESELDVRVQLYKEFLLRAEGGEYAAAQYLGKEVHEGDVLHSVEGNPVVGQTFEAWASDCASGVARHGWSVVPIVSKDGALSAFARIDCLSAASAAVFRPAAAHREELIRVRDAERRKREETATASELAAMAAAADAARQRRAEEEERQRREAAAAAAERTRKEAASRRLSGEAFTFGVVFEAPGPMGLTLDLTAAVATVDEAVGKAKELGVVKGDILVAINAMETSGMKPAAVTRALGKATWPRHITLHVPAAAVADGDALEGTDGGIPLILTVFEPAIVREEYSLLAPKAWGAAPALVEQTGSTCEPSLLLLTEPLLACDNKRLSLVMPILVAEGGTAAATEAMEPRAYACSGSGGGDAAGPAESCSAGDGNSSSSSGSVITLVRRGSCTFVDKARNVQDLLLQEIGNNANAEREGADSTAGSTARVALVVVNTEDELSAMPKGQMAAADEVNILVAMLAAGNATALERLLSWGVPIRATIAPPGRCPLPAGASAAPSEAAAASNAATAAAAAAAAAATSNKNNRASKAQKPPKDDGGGGRLLAHWRGGAKSYGFKLAQYGWEPESRSSQLVAAEPADGCDERAMTVRVAGAWALVRRGGCSFGRKTLAAQRAGAVGVVLVNSDESTMRLMGTEEEAKEAYIPTIAVGFSAGEELRKAALSGSGGGGGLLVRPYLNPSQQENKP